MSNKILLHTCCAVCFAHPKNLLEKLGFEVVCYFYNPNIYPENEYNRRFLELKKYCYKNSFELIEEKNEPDEFNKIAIGLENEPEKGERCLKCYELRLNKTAKKAVELGISKFTTTLSVSPHKPSKNVFLAGNKASEKHSVEFLEIDFKKHDGFKTTQEIAKKEGLYKQNYCGCCYSISSNA
jgi:predicted adenine nucleotide alpha hydrolase (AANH) superfamily ATPase